MKNLKKLIASMMIFVLIIGTFVGCSGGNSKEVNNDSGSEDQVNVVENVDPSLKVPVIDLWLQSQTKDPIRYEAGLMIADNWRKLGFEVNAETREWATMSAEGMKAHDHDVFMVKWGGKPERIDPYHWLYSMHHSDEAVEGGYNITGYLNPEYDKLAKTFATSLDSAERQAAAKEMQVLLAQDVPQPPMFKLKLKNAYNNEKFTNVTPGVGLGVYSFWNFMNITPITDDKILNLGQTNDINLLNPLATKTGQDLYMLKNIYDPLVRLDVKGDVVNWLATEVNDIDDTTIEVTIRDDVYFHDGEQLTVEDVKFTFDFAKEIKSPTYNAYVRNIESIDIVGDQTVKFNLSEPYAPFLTNTLSQVLILPEHIWASVYEEKGAEGVLTWENDEPVGSGPFKFDYWRPNEEFALKANKDHFQVAHIDGIVRTPYTQSFGIVQGLIAGEIEMTSYNMMPLDLEEVAKASHVEIVELPDAGSYIIHYNMRHKPFDDVWARRALTMAIPRQAILDIVFDGGALKTFTLVTEDNIFWTNPDVEKLDFDLEKAKAELVEAGYQWDVDGAIYYPENFEPTPIME
ncbi:ABC transporter substrate-binding protein [Clostridiaceae bacterium HSG29]|nr:ABC transporter substrate-binding protein [Clostridiaceae bacterium HSG29]